MTLRMEAGGAGRTYKIGQAAKLLDVKPFVLRFWEGEFGDVLVPVRTPSGQRAYTEDNLATVRAIKTLLYDEGLTIEGAKKRLLHAPGQQPPPEPAAPPPPRPCAPVQAELPAAPVLEAQAAPQAELLRHVARELAALRDLLSPR